MKILHELFNNTFKNIGIELYRFIPLFIVVIISILLSLIVKSIINHWKDSNKYKVVKVTFIILYITIIFISIIITIPVSPQTRGDIVTLLGIVVSAILTLSSTTFVGNGLAGLFLQTTTHFKPGNFIEVDDKFGRVTEMGILHTEIQTDESNLMTLPNLYLVTHPVTVIRDSSTLITAELSLGYDVPHQIIEDTLKEAALHSGLTRPFVRILELGDYSIVYQCAGVLEGVKQLLATRSRLKLNIIDFLHSKGIEIVSPSFMNQRKLTEDKVFIPSPDHDYRPGWGSEYSGPGDDLVFDKAEKAAIYEDIKSKLENLEKEIVELNKRLNSTDDENERNKIQNLIENNNSFKEFLTNQKEKMDND